MQSPAKTTDSGLAWSIVLQIDRSCLWSNEPGVGRFFARSLGCRQMPKSPNQEVLIPFLKEKIPLFVDIGRHRTMEIIKKWGSTLKKIIEEACFANYKEKIASTGHNSSIPRICKANEVWKHLKVESIRIDACVDDTIVLHLVPEWNIDLQMELCIKGDQLVYAGQFLLYQVDGYANLT
jgi:hypothetical protein